ncbi:MAG: hypothetical protein R3217_09065 [Gammaproteobacteria bacterium]|nr:hypothetical protein [Gammaproteobacteria bacterium]
MTSSVAGGLRLLVAGTLMLITTACVTYGHQLASVDNALQQGNVSGALQLLDALGASRRNEVLYLVNKGAILRMQGDIEGSIAAFEAAKPLMRFQEATSISETLGELSVVEGSDAYQPRPFEQLHMRAMQALNFLETGDVESARVEALQIDAFLERAFDGAAPQGGDAFPLYLSGLIFEANGEPDAALVSYRKAYRAYQRQPGPALMPRDLGERLVYLADRLGLDSERDEYARAFPSVSLADVPDSRQRQLLVVVGAGLVPRRVEVSQVQQDQLSGKIYRLSLPRLVSRTSRVAQVTAQFAGEAGIAGERVSMLEPVARATLEDEMPGLIARAIARNVVKNAAANQAGKESEGLELFVNFVSAVVENADVRSWSTLPGEQFLLRVPLPDDVGDVTVSLQDRFGVPLFQETFDVSSLAENRTAFRSLYWLQR